MSLLRTALILAALSSASPAPAAVVLTLGDALLSRRLAVEDTLASASTAQRYFDADALLTLGAMALAGGALAGAARRPRAARVRVPAFASSHPAIHPRDAA